MLDLLGDLGGLYDALKNILGLLIHPFINFSLKYAVMLATTVAVSRPKPSETTERLNRSQSINTHKKIRCGFLPLVSIFCGKSEYRKRSLKMIRDSEVRMRRTLDIKKFLQKQS